jgi:predicted permease
MVHIMLAGIISILAQSMHDLRLTVRVLIKNPSFVIATILMLGFGTGVNAALFGILHSVVLQPLPTRQPEQLVTLSQQASGGVSVPDLEDLSVQTHSFQQMEAYTFAVFSLRDSSGTELLTGAQVTSGYLAMLGVRPLLGRTFGPEQAPGREDHAALLCEGLWKSRFAKNPDILGKTITLNGQPYMVLGVMPQEVRLPYDNTQVWIPVPSNFPPVQNRGTHGMRMLARLKPGISIQDAQTDMSVVTARLAQQYPKEDGGRSVILLSLHEATVSYIRQKLYLLGFAVVFIFLIAIANVASLSLTRASYRLREMAIRKALGATRTRLISQLAMENFVLAVFGSVVGWILALWWVRLIVALKPAKLPRLHEIQLDYTVFLLLVVLTFVIAALLSAVNIFQLERLKPNEVLGAGGRGSTEGYRPWLRNILVGVEMATAVLLLIGAGLLIRSFQKIYTVDLGFNPQKRLTMHLSVPVPARTRPASQIYQPIYDAVHSVPGVVAVGLCNTIPLQNSFDAEYFIEGLTSPDSHNSGEVRLVNEDYFKALGMRLLSGREFTATDNEGSPRVAIINKKMATQWFPNADPIGHRIRTLGSQEWISIIGIVADIRDNTIGTEGPLEFYLPYRQNPYPPAMWNTGLVVQTVADPASTVSAIKKAIQSANPEITLSGIISFDEIIADSLRDQRLAMTLLAIFAGLALILATYGIYALLAYSVLQRTREIGVRMAIGADRWRILSHFVFQGMQIVVVSQLIGTIGAYLLSQVLANLLFGIKAKDPLTFILANAVLIATAACAILFPAWNGARLEPQEALRFE